MRTASLVVASAIIALLAAPAFASSPPKFTATCPTGITVKSNGTGKVRINGKKATVKAFSDTAWEARANGISIDFGWDGADLTATYTKGSANGICKVTSGGTRSSTGAPAGSNAAGDLNGVAPKDQQACLAAVSRTANNGDVDIVDAVSSEANNTVIIGVGPKRAQWKCLVKNGRVGDVMSMTDEGAL